MSTAGVSALTTSAIGAVRGLTVRKAFVQDVTTGHHIIQIDASIKENHSIEAPPSEFPIESGQVITDNFIVKPFTLEMEGHITDDPINPLTTAATSLISTFVPPSGIVAIGAVGSAISIFNTLQGSKNPSIANFNQLVAIMKNKRAVNVYTTLNFYQNMWLSSLHVTRDSKSGNSLEFTARFVQIILVQPQTVNVAKYANSGVSAAQANLGKTGTNLSNVFGAAFQNGVVSGVSYGTF